MRITSNIINVLLININKVRKVCVGKFSFVDKINHGSLLFCFRCGWVGL